MKRIEIHLTNKNKNISDMKKQIRKEIEAIHHVHGMSGVAVDRILDLFNVVEQDEQLPCDCKVPLAETDLQHYCPKCWKTWKIK
jgi:hypothetical protein